MIKMFLLGLTGCLSGVLGGMGMGGGTILIPALTIFFSVEQKTAQGINLVAFIPMAIVSLVIHVKQGRVEKKGIAWIILPAAICSFLSGLAAQSINGDILKRAFGGFLALLSAVQFFSEEITEKIESLAIQDKKR